MKTIDEIRAELAHQLRARKDEARLITAALLALDGEEVDDLQFAEDAIDQEAHGGEQKPKGMSPALTTGARDAIVRLKDGPITVVALEDELGCSKSWARYMLRAAEAKGMVELTAGKLGVEKVWRYVVPSAQAAARARHAVTQEASVKPVPGTGRKTHDSKNRREVAKAAAAAGVPVTTTRSGHMKVGTETVSKSGSGRRRANVDAAIRRQAAS
jgi:DNA-binding Lrp family transcriptional regulator